MSAVNNTRSGTSSGLVRVVKPRTLAKRDAQRIEWPLPVESSATGVCVLIAAM